MFVLDVTMTMTPPRILTFSSCSAPATVMILPPTKTTMRITAGRQERPMMMINRILVEKKEKKNVVNPSTTTARTPVGQHERPMMINRILEEK